MPLAHYLATAQDVSVKNRRTPNAGAPPVQRRSLGRTGLAATSFLIGVLCSVSPCFAVPEHVLVEQLQHTAWTAKDGAPSYTRQFAQTTDGALWLASDAGLFRFDGFRFERFNPAGTESKPLRAVSTVLATADGGLWIGMRLGGIYRLDEDGRLTFHGEQVGLPSDRTVERLVQAPDGKILAGTSEGLFTFAAGRWKRAEQRILARSFIYNLLFDRSGNLWMSGLDGHFLLEKGAGEPKRLFLPPGRGYLTEDSSGAIWTTTSPDDRTFPHGLVQLTADPAVLPPDRRRGLRLNAPAGNVITDKDGGLWLARDEGIVRISDPRRIGFFVKSQDVPTYAEVSEKSQRLTHNAPISIFEDRDGNIWIGTSNGVDRLRIPKLLKVRRDSLPIVMAETSLHTMGTPHIFACDSAGGLFRIGGVDPIALPGRDCQAIAIDAAGTPWVAVAGQILRRTSNSYVHVPTPAEMNPIRMIAGLRFDGRGRLWVSSVREGIFSYSDGSWQRHSGTGVMPETAAVTIGTDTQGRPWFGFPGSRALLWSNEQAKLIDSSLGLRTGDIQTIEPYGKGVFIGGSEGMAISDGENVRMLRGAGGETFQGITAFFPGDESDWWLHGRNGIYRVEDREIQAALRNDAHDIRFEILDHRDGLVGNPAMMYAVPSGRRAADGRLWFATTAGVFSFQPTSRTSRGALPPPAVELRNLVLEGRPQAVRDGQHIALPSATRRLQIDFAALSITMPERVRFRYRLVGTGEDWQITSVPSATYTSLQPGTYKFELAATHGNGTWGDEEWSASPSALSIEIHQPLYRQSWFYLLCVLAVAVAAALLHRLRVRQVAAKVRLQAEARAKERERIARDLHDTLLQSTQGLVLGMQAMANAMPADGPTKQRLDKLLSRADAAIIEGRDKVWALRSEAGADAMLNALRALAAEHESPRLEITVRCEGAIRELPPDVADELFQIAREAARNAATHADAQHICISVIFSSRDVILCVTDDGRGMAQVLQSGAPSGRWGLQGMRERAEGIGGKFYIESAPKGGTVVTVKLSGRHMTRKSSK